MKKIYIKPTIERVETTDELLQMGHHSGGMQGGGDLDDIGFGGDGNEDDEVDSKYNLWDDWDD